MNKQDQKNSIVLYSTSKGIELDVRFEGETLWMTQAQISQLYGKERSVITKHVNKIFSDKEVDKKSNVQKLHIAGSDKPVNVYGLDIILAIGYRTSSSKAIQFRKWATRMLKNYLLEGYVVNEKRLTEAQEKFASLQSVVSLLADKSSRENLHGQENELLTLLLAYTKTLTVLEQYDKKLLVSQKGNTPHFTLTYEDAQKVLEQVRGELVTKGEATDLFARERDGAFQGVIRGLYQTFAGKELYKTTEDKAAHLLYFVIKDHPFSDGNKPSGAFLFVYFLNKNNLLYKKNGEKKLNDNALVALALLVAESDPKEKGTMVNLIANLLTDTI